MTRSLLYFLHILLIFHLRITKSSATTNDAQVEALLRWKNSLLSTYPTILDSWSVSNKESLCKTWFGIQCSIDGSVSVLSLYNASLTGTLERFNFTCFPKLIIFELPINLLNGSIPSEIGNLKELQILGLENNHITGNIPFQISHLQKLRMLYLSNNDLKSPDWSKFRSMPLLANIDLSYNELKGVFPDFILTCHNLTYLDFSSNKFNGSIPKSLFTNLGQLNTLHLNDNLFEGSLSSIFPKLPKPLSIEDISLRNNSLVGEIPSFIGECKNLTWLDLSHNSLTGNLPFPLSNLTKIYYLSISDNSLSGEISHHLFTNWTKINYIYLQNNFFTGRIPSSIGVLTNLGHLMLYNNSLSGNIPSSLCNASSLVWLDLSINKLNGIIPQCLGNSSQLYIIKLSNNDLHGTIPEMFTKGNQLQYLMLSENQLEGPFPKSLINCRSLEVLDVGNNLLKDVFPQWLETLPDLQVLVLRSNKLYGSIGNSKTMSPFSNLKIFDIANNKLSGLLPTFYFKHFEVPINETLNTTIVQDQYYIVSMTLHWKGRVFYTLVLKIMVSIDLSCNNFQGEIPRSIGKLKSLKCLNLSHNNLTGHIPLAMRNLINIEMLDLSYNKLVGRIPSELVEITFLSVFNLSYNNLDGPIPHGGQFPFENNSYIGNFALCGDPLTKRCDDHGGHKEYDDSSSLFDHEAALIGYGCGTLIGLGIGSLLLSYGKIKWIDNISRKKQRRRA